MGYSTKYIKSLWNCNILRVNNIPSQTLCFKNRNPLKVQCFEEKIADFIECNTNVLKNSGYLSRCNKIKRVTWETI